MTEPINAEQTDAQPDARHSDISNPFAYLHIMLDELLDKMRETRKFGGESTAVLSPNLPDLPKLQLSLRVMMTPLDDTGNPEIVHVNEAGQDVPGQQSLISEPHSGH